MGPSRRTLLFLLLAGFFLAPIPAFAQVDVWPSDLYKPPGEPSCMTISVSGGSNATVDIQIDYPSGGPYYWYGVQLNGNGQVYACIDGSWEEGQYNITAFGYSGSWFPASAPFSISPAPPPPPVIYSSGAGCDNWDCIWATGLRFHTDSRVEVYTTDWAYHETYYGAAWQMSPLLVVDEVNGWLALQLVDPNLRTSFGWNGLNIRVVNNDGTSTPWTWVGVAAPTITAGVPTCSDLYCVQLDGVFPLNAYVDLRVPNTWEYLPDSYTDLVVTATQITLRLNPGVRHVYDTTGLWAFAVNPAIFNWSSPYYLPPVDRSVIGNIDGISVQGNNFYLWGWACAKTSANSIDVHVYLGGPSGGGGTLAFTGTANQASEPAVATACNSTGTHYRFSLQIPTSVLEQYPGVLIYVHGISPFGLTNLTIGNSGSFQIPGVAPVSLKEYIYLGGRVIAVESQ